MAFTAGDLVEDGFGRYRVVATDVLRPDNRYEGKRVEMIRIERLTGVELSGWWPASAYRLVPPQRTYVVCVMGTVEVKAVSYEEAIDKAKAMSVSGVTYSATPK